MKTRISSDQQIIEMIDTEETSSRKRFPERVPYKVKISRSSSSDIFGGLVAKHILGKPVHEHDHYAEHFNWHPNCHPESGGPPYWTTAITILCIVYFMKYNVNCAKDDCWRDSRFYLSTDHEINQHDTWRYFTYSFLHVDSSHISSNLLIFIPTGILLELVHGSMRVGSIFTLGTICGALTHLAWQHGALIGASAGIYAVLGASVANLIKNGDVMMHSLFTVRVAFWGVVAIGFAWETYTGVTAEEDSGISWSSHVGGFFTGMTYGMYILTNFEDHYWEKLLERSSIAIFWICFIINALRA